MDITLPIWPAARRCIQTKKPMIRSDGQQQRDEAAEEARLRACWTRRRRSSRRAGRRSASGSGTGPGGAELLAVVQLAVDVAGVVVVRDRRRRCPARPRCRNSRVGDVLAARPRHQERDEERRGQEAEEDPDGPLRDAERRRPAVRAAAGPSPAAAAGHPDRGRAADGGAEGAGSWNHARAPHEDDLRTRSVGTRGPRLTASAAWSQPTELSSPPMRRQCSRPGCAEPAVATVTYHYGEQAAWLDPLSAEREPHAYDMCAPPRRAICVRPWAGRSTTAACHVGLHGRLAGLIGGRMADETATARRHPRSRS